MCSYTENFKSVHLIFISLYIEVDHYLSCAAQNLKIINSMNAKITTDCIPYIARYLGHLKVRALMFHPQQFSIKRAASSDIISQPEEGQNSSDTHSQTRKQNTESAESTTRVTMMIRAVARLLCVVFFALLASTFGPVPADATGRLNFVTLPRGEVPPSGPSCRPSCPPPAPRLAH